MPPVPALPAFNPAPAGPPDDPSRTLAPLLALQALQDSAGAHAQALELGTVQVLGRPLPLRALAFGSRDPQAPAMAVVGGVHGLERIGCEVALAFLRSLVARLDWDETLHHLLSRMRLVVMPLVNPGGWWLGTRANPNGVDLMRNAPVAAQAPVPFLVGGQRLSRHLPWYCGPAGAAMEPESAALVGLVQRELLGRPFSLVVDCHSGFGLRDRLWFPYAHTARPMRHLAEVHALCEVLDRSLPHHPYVFEPQSRHYLTHGDLWDHLCLPHETAPAEGPAPVFLPLTLEMGSWLWVKKNPRQLFSRLGIFNPLIDHRQQRVLRRHLLGLDVLMRATLGHAHWRPVGAAREVQRARALARWYAPRVQRA